jgi:hypothetical protein
VLPRFRAQQITLLQQKTFLLSSLHHRPAPLALQLPLPVTHQLLLQPWQQAQVQHQLLIPSLLLQAQHLAQLHCLSLLALSLALQTEQVIHSPQQQQMAMEPHRQARHQVR